MPNVCEYQIAMPVSVEEYQVAQLFAVAKASEQETTGEDGVEIVKNEPFEQDGVKGQYTFKIYHLGKRLPGWLSSMLPKDLKQVREEAWNAFPNCKTVISSPYLGEKFEIKIESKHLPFDAAVGMLPNVHGLDEKQLKKRSVEVVDIAFSHVDDKKCPDPKTFKSTKTGRGPLDKKGWQLTANPAMVCYKLCSIKVDYALVGGKVEKWIQGFEKNLFTTFHRKVFCWIDDWFGLSIADIRRMEEETRARNRARLAAVAGKGDAGAKPVDLEHDPAAVAAAEAAAAAASPTLPDTDGCEAGAAAAAGAGGSPAK